ncbi:helix-turn-helix domain-containing protein [Enterobacter sp. UPMP2052]
MPWAETRPMQRLDFIRACHAGTDSLSALCRLFGISRKTCYKWLERFDRKRLARTVLIFTERSEQLSRATDRVPGLPASPGYVQ